MTQLTKRARLATVDLEIVLKEFRGHRAMVSEISTRVDGLKKTLMQILERNGRPDEKGSLWLEFDPPVAGYAAIKRERRAKVLLDEDKATRILKERGLYQDCIDVDITIDAEQMDEVLAALRAAGLYDKVVTVTERLSDDRIMQAYFAAKDSEDPALTEADIDSMFREEVTYAFVPRDAT